MAVIRAVLLVTLLAALASGATAIWCEADNCYELLGVKSDATGNEIRKAYYKLSLKLHPDKNQDNEHDAAKQFQKVATAYEILKDDERRRQYDYVLAHPDEYFYNAARFYRSYYGPKGDIRYIVVGLITILSGFQYFNDHSIYKRAVRNAKQTPIFKSRLKALREERQGGAGKKKGKGKKGDDVDMAALEKELEQELHIHGAEPPKVWRLLALRLLILPYTIAKFVLWEARWVYRYNIKKQPYTTNDAAYLTRRVLGLPEDRWLVLEESDQSDLINKQLWVGLNYDAFVEEERKNARKSKGRLRFRGARLSAAEYESDDFID